MEENTTSLERQRASEPLDDDLLSSQPAIGGPERAVAPGLDGDEPPAPRDPARSMTRAAWALVAVVAVFGALVFAELLRLSSDAGKTVCLQKALAINNATAGPGITASDAGLARLSLRLAANKCDH